MKKEYNYLMKQKLLFSDIFEIKEDKLEKDKESNEETEDKEKKEENNNINKNNNQQENNNVQQKKDSLLSTTKILIYYGTKKDIIIFNSNQTISELTEYLNKSQFISNKNNFKILYGLKELKLNDNRKLKEIISSDDKNFQIRVIINNKEKEYIKNNKIEKVYVSLENIPSFMDLSDQINNFIDKYKKEIKYDIKYKNNCCNITFLSSEISFSFVTYMTNLKFSNKYYRNLRIKLKYNNANYSKNNHLSNNSIIQNERNNSLLNSINNKNLKINIKKSYDKKNAGRHKSESYEHISVNTEPNQINDYFNDKYNFINESIPYEQEKILNKLEKEKNKQKWITYKGFFNGVNKKSFNSFINPYKKKISLSNIINNKEKKILLNINSL
jgi:hypothetical protein